MAGGALRFRCRHVGRRRELNAPGHGCAHGLLPACVAARIHACTHADRGRHCTPAAEGRPDRHRDRSRAPGRPLTPRGPYGAGNGVAEALRVAGAAGATARRSESALWETSGPAHRAAPHGAQSPPAKGKLRAQSVLLANARRSSGPAHRPVRAALFPRKRLTLGLTALALITSFRRLAPAAEPPGLCRGRSDIPPRRWPTLRAFCAGRRSPGLAPRRSDG
jgi:hypothetical protein